MYFVVSVEVIDFFFFDWLFFVYGKLVMVYIV